MRFTRSFLAAALVCLPLAALAQSPQIGPVRTADACQIEFRNAGTSLNSKTVCDALIEIAGGGGGGGASAIDYILNGSTVSTGIGEVECANSIDSACTEPIADRFKLDVSPFLMSSELNTKAELNTQIGDGDVVTAITGSSGGSTSGTTVSLLGSGGITTPRSGDTITVTQGEFTQAASISTGKWAESWTTEDPDSPVGTTNCGTSGSGCDPNPFTGDRSSTIRTGVRSALFTYDTDWIHTLSAYNSLGGGSAVDSDNYAAENFIEYSYDGGQRSGAELVEWNFDVTPATHQITITAGTGSGIVRGENVAFTGGESCRPTGPLAGTGTVRMTCVNKDAPESSDVITGGCAGCTGTWTVSSTPTADSAYRQFFMHWITETNRTSFGFLGAPSTPVLDYQGGAFRMVIAGGTSPTATLQLPANTSSSFPDPGLAGEVKVDTSGDTTTGGQLIFHDGTDDRVLQATNTQCFPQTDLDAADDDVNFPAAFYQPITIIAAGCRSDTTASPTTAATLAFETLGAASMTLTPTCVGSATAMTWATTTDPDAALASGAGFRFDTTNTPNPATDEYTICVAYRATRQ